MLQGGSDIHDNEFVACTVIGCSHHPIERCLDILFVGMLCFVSSVSLIGVESRWLELEKKKWITILIMGVYV